jgi:hypothetical protein
MAASNLVLVASAGSVGRIVLEHLRAQDVPVRGMSVSPDYLLAATVVATVAQEYGKLVGLVDLSQMTVSQMTALARHGWRS